MIQGLYVYIERSKKTKAVKKIKVKSRFSIRIENMYMKQLDEWYKLINLSYKAHRHLNHLEEGHSFLIQAPRSLKHDV